MKEKRRKRRKKSFWRFRTTGSVPERRTAKGKWRKGGKEEKENTSIKGRKGTERKGKGGKDMTDVFECVGMS